MWLTLTISRLLLMAKSFLRSFSAELQEANESDSDSLTPTFISLQGPLSPDAIAALRKSWEKCREIQPDDPTDPADITAPFETAKMAEILAHAEKHNLFLGRFPGAPDNGKYGFGRTTGKMCWAATLEEAFDKWCGE